MIPIKVAILWHFHQPYYKKDDRFMLPWVRLHGVKDYWDLPELFYEFPNIKQTVNIVPSLDIQVKEYVAKSTFDNIQLLSYKHADSLTDDEKSAILDSFFLCNNDNMILPYDRYKELFNAAKDKKHALVDFSTQDWLDLQVWYNLTWLGQFSRKKSFVSRLFIKERGFNEEEKALLLDVHLDILSSINTQLKMLKDLGQLELSCSPMYHPILPLLCDSEAVLEASPNQELPDPIFRHPEDADNQIKKSIDFFNGTFNYLPQGMWPSEGSISDEAMQLFADNNISWVATDESVLFNSLNNTSHCEKYFPRQYKTKDGKAINIFFRDHSLSDAIGFIYSSWNPKDAALDFTNRLKKIKFDIINEYGEQALNNAVIPVILDGENCWEFYKDNGINFLRELFRELSDKNEFSTVTFTEALENNSNQVLNSINHIRAGSWINADFKIWLGHQEHVLAWSYLSEARNTFEENKANFDDTLTDKIYNELLIAEGSDWFWWYGDAHWAPNKSDFDILFRWRLSHIYKLMQLEVPEYLNIPLSQAPQFLLFKDSVGNINPDIYPNEEDNKSWEHAACYNAKIAMSTMHISGEFIDLIYFGKNTDNFFVKICFNDNFKENDSVVLEFFKDKSLQLMFHKNHLVIQSTVIQIKRFEYAYDKALIISLDLKSLAMNSDQDIYFKVKTVSESQELLYPLNDFFKLKL